MAHKFDRTTYDPYADAAHNIEQNMVTGDFAYEADAQSQVYDTLSNVVVSALGDIAATAFRLGINDPGRLRGLATAISKSAEGVLLSYQGEVDSRPVLEALRTDHRLMELPAEQQSRLAREIEKTRQLEDVVLTARRLPDLLDLAGQLGLHVPDDVVERGDIIMTTHPTPTHPTASSIPSERT
jgi:hypothetical protein